MPGLSIVSAKWPEEHTASLPATPFSKLTTQRPGGSFMAIFWFLQSAKQTQGHQRGNKCRATCHLFELFREGREVWTSWSWITPLLSHHMLTPQVEGTEPDTCSVPLGQHDGSVSGSQILTPLPHRHGDGRLSSVRVLRGWIRLQRARWSPPFCDKITTGICPVSCCGKVNRDTNTTSVVFSG